MRSDGGGSLARWASHLAGVGTGSSLELVVVVESAGDVALDRNGRMDSKVVDRRATCHIHGCSRSRMKLVCDSRLEWRWDLMLGVLGGMALLEEEESSQFAVVASVALSLGWWGMAGWNRSVHVAAGAGSLDAVALNGLIRRTTLQ